MPVRSLLVTIDPGERVRRGVLYVLSRDPRLHIGEVVEGCLPVWTEQLSDEEGADLIEQLRQVPGVRFVQLIGISDVVPFPPGHHVTKKRARPAKRAAEPAPRSGLRVRTGGSPRVTTHHERRRG